MLRPMVRYTSVIVGDVVLVKVQHAPNEIAQCYTKVHDREMHQYESSSVAQVLVEDIAYDDENCSQHGEDAGEANGSSECRTTCPVSCAVANTLRITYACFTILKHDTQLYTIEISMLQQLIEIQYIKSSINHRYVY